MINNRNQNELEFFLKKIDQRPELATFFNRLEDDPNLRRLFMLHRNELFLGYDDVTFPLLLSASNTKGNTSFVLTLIQDIDTARSQSAYNSLTFLFDKLPSALFDVISYGIIMLARRNEDIKALVTGEFTFSKMRSVLKNVDYDTYWNELGDTINETEDPSLLQLKKELETTVKGWANQFKTHPMKFLESFVNLVPNFYLAIHNDASSHVSTILEKSEMSPDEYNQTLSLLYSLKLITRQDSVFRCDRCIDEPQLLHSSSMIGPNNMKIKCPRCGHQMSYSAILWIDNMVKASLLSRDGLLTIALARLLDKKKISFESFVTDDKYEYDFICDTNQGKILVECKVHRFPESERSVKGSIEQNLKQALKHKLALNLPLAVVIYNYNLEHYKETVEKGIEKYGVNLIGFNEAPDYFESLSSSR